MLNVKSNLKLNSKKIYQEIFFYVQFFCENFWFLPKFQFGLSFFQVLSGPPGDFIPVMFYMVTCSLNYKSWFSALFAIFDYMGPKKGVAPQITISVWDLKKFLVAAILLLSEAINILGCLIINVYKTECTTKSSYISESLICICTTPWIVCF